MGWVWTGILRISPLKCVKKTSAFETLDGQYALFDGLGDEEQEQFLDETLRKVEDTRYIDEIHKRWRNGDAEGRTLADGRR